MKNILIKLIQSPENYARFLNTLSLLEYIGARKIIKSQHQDQLNEKILAHMSEEIRHAEVLKRAALKIAPQVCQTYAPEALICGREAWQYFQAIDQAAARELDEKNSWNCYLYTTWLIETRAINFYTLFEEVLQQQGKPSVFRGILVEEHRHLDEIATSLQNIPGHDAKLARLKVIEELEFKNWINAIERTISL